MPYNLHWYRHSWCDKVAAITDGPWRITVKVEVDTDYDWTDGRGRFIHRFVEGAIKSPWRHERNTFAWFVPEETLRERIDGWLQEEGYTIQLARQRAVETLKEDIRIACDGGEYIALGVTAKVYLDATSTELASASCWGIEVKSANDPYIGQVAQEQIEEALHDAKEAIQRLKIALEQLPD